MFYHALEIDEGTCIGCSRCMKVCPTEAVRITGGKASIDDDRCIDCGKCHAACPVEAIFIKQDDFKMVHEFPHSIALVPSVFLGQFPDDVRPSRVYDVLKQLGFKHVFEVESAAAIYADAKNAHYETNPKAYTITKRVVKKGDVLKLQEAPGGGFAVSLLVKQ